MPSILEQFGPSLLSSYFSYVLMFMLLLCLGVCVCAFVFIFFVLYIMCVFYLLPSGEIKIKKTKSWYG